MYYDFLIYLCLIRSEHRRNKSWIELPFIQSQRVFFTYLDAFKQLNQSADPCTDFYEYACGGWEDENALEAGETSVTGFSLVKEKSYNILKNALENAKRNYSNVRKTCLYRAAYTLYTYTQIHVS